MSEIDLIFINSYKVPLKVVSLIDDPRLEPNLEMIHGKQEHFRHKQKPDEKHEWLSAANAEFSLDRPEPHYQAQLLNGKWYWVNACYECNGHERDWMCHDECDKHDVCRTCKCTRAELTSIPWGGKKGWQCKPCAEHEHQVIKQEALAKAAEKKYDPWDYENLDSIICPYCNTQRYDSWEYSDANDDTLTCDTCDNSFKVTANHTVNFTTERIEKKGARTK